MFAGRGALVGLYQGDARLAQGINAGGHCQLAGHVEGFDKLARHAVLLGEVERAGAAGQFDDVGCVADCLEATAAVFALYQSGDLLVDHEVAEALGDEIDELLAAQDALGIVGGHHQLVDAGQAQAGAADDDRTKGRLVAIIDAPMGGLAVGLEHLG